MKGKNMKLKYKFSYGNFGRYIVNQILLFLLTCSEMIMLLGLILKIDLYIFKGIFYEITAFLLGAFPIYSIVISAILISIPRKAVINDEFLKINRHYLNPMFITRGFNDKIFYKDIIECKKCPGKDSTSALTTATIWFDWSRGVEIVVENYRNDRVYLFAVQNPDDFINEVNKRVELAKSKENDETSQSAVPTNMFQFDLQRGYMPDCDEIVLGVNGVEFKTDKTTADLINVKSISYNDILLCKKSDKLSINGIDSDNIVEIKTATQTYYIPIKNPYNFINELYKKLNTCNQ